MGFAGVAMLFGIFAFIKFIIALIRYLVWFRKDKVTGVVSRMLSETQDGKKLIRKYEIEITHKSKRMKRSYTQTAEGDTPRLGRGETIEFYYDPKKDEAQEVKDIKSAVWVWLVAFIGCVALFFLAYLIYSAMTK